MFLKLNLNSIFLQLFLVDFAYLGCVFKVIRRFAVEQTFCVWDILSKTWSVLFGLWILLDHLDFSQEWRFLPCLPIYITLIRIFLYAAFFIMINWQYSMHRIVSKLNCAFFWKIFYDFFMQVQVICARTRLCVCVCMYACMCMCV